MPRNGRITTYFYRGPGYNNIQTEIIQIQIRADTVEHTLYTILNIYYYIIF